MPILENCEKNIIFELNLTKNQYLDINNPSKYESWIPFVLKLLINGKVYAYSEEQCASFTCFEIENFLMKLENIIYRKKNKLEFDRYEYSSSEAYFDFIIYDPLEENEVYIEIWINIGTYSKGELFGFDEGVRFVTTIAKLDSFRTELYNQMKQILKDTNNSIPNN
jgi:hypothetical protein